MTTPPDTRDIAARLVAALTDAASRTLPNATPPPPFRPLPDSPPGRSAGRIRPWAVPVLAAAVVVALTVGALVLTRSAQHSSRPSPANRPTAFVTLRATAQLSAAEMEAARQIISARAAVLGASHADVRIVGTEEITASLPGVAPADVGDLGAVDALRIRPLVINSTVPAATSSGNSAGPRRVVDQWKSLGFPPPKDAAAYDALSPVQQSAVRAVLNRWDCGNAPLDLPGAPIVTCDTLHTAKFLLGAAIVTGNQHPAATAVDQSGIGGVGWGVVLSMEPAEQRQWASYTARHNEMLHPTDTANVVAVTVDSDVIQASTLQATITGPTEIVTGLSQREATRLAGFLLNGILPVQFHVVSVNSR